MKCEGERGRGFLRIACLEENIFIRHFVNMSSFTSSQIAPHAANGKSRRNNRGGGEGGSREKKRGGGGRVRVCLCH